VTGQLTVRPVSIPAEGTWHFDRYGASGQLEWGPPDNYAPKSAYDPFPAYPHDEQLVAEAAGWVAKAVPPLWDITIWLADREPVARTNGHSGAWIPQHYDDSQAWVHDQPRGMILLAGKRIPPHPAVTRYLVGHEYGHHVEYMLNDLRGAPHLHDTALVTGYAEMRGLPVPVHHGTGGRWHDAAPEIFACDCRIVLFGIEPDFWPHPGIPRPGEVPAVRAWWNDAITDLNAARENSG
jgi:hypothetical protein